MLLQVKTNSSNSSSSSNHNKYYYYYYCDYNQDLSLLLIPYLLSPLSVPS